MSETISSHSPEHHDREVADYEAVLAFRERILKMNQAVENSGYEWWEKQLGQAREGHVIQSIGRMLNTHDGSYEIKDHMALLEKIIPRPTSMNANELPDDMWVIWESNPRHGAPTERIQSYIERHAAA